MRLLAVVGVSGDDDKSIISTIGEGRSIMDGVDGEHKSMMSLVVVDDVAAVEDGVLGILPTDLVIGVLGILPVETIVFVGVCKSTIRSSSCWTILLTKP